MWIHVGFHLGTCGACWDQLQWCENKKGQHLPAKTAHGLPLCFVTCSWAKANLDLLSTFLRASFPGSNINIRICLSRCFRPQLHHLSTLSCSSVLWVSTLPSSPLLSCCLAAAHSLSSIIPGSGGLDWCWEHRLQMCPFVLVQSFCLGKPS